MPIETEPVDGESAPLTTEDADIDGIAESRDPAAEEPPLDVVFDLLSNERRRRVLRYLLEESEATTLGELAEHIAAIENEKPERALSSTERKRVYIALYQAHLPKMDDAGVIDFDEDRKTVRACDHLSAVTGYLREEDDAEGERNGAAFFLALALVVGGALAVQGYLAPNAWLSGLLIGVLIVSIATAALKLTARSPRSPRRL